MMDVWRLIIAIMVLRPAVLANPKVARPVYPLMAPVLLGALLLVEQIVLMEESQQLVVLQEPGFIRPLQGEGVGQAVKLMVAKLAAHHKL